MDKILVALREKQKEIDEKAPQKQIELEKLAREEAARKLEEKAEAMRNSEFTKCNEHIIHHFSEQIDAGHIIVSTAWVPGKAVGGLNHTALVSGDCDRHLDFKYITDGLSTKYPKLQFRAEYMEGSEGLGYSSHVSCYFTEKERKGWLW